MDMRTENRGMATMDIPTEAEGTSFNSHERRIRCATQPIIPTTNRQARAYITYCAIETALSSVGNFISTLSPLFINFGCADNH
jgi:hypothetical protein